MIFDIVLSVVAAGAGAIGAWRFHVVKVQADVLDQRLDLLTRETYEALRSIVQEMGEHWDKWAADAERVAGWGVALEENLTRIDAHDKAADAWRAEVKRRFTRIERDPTLPRDAFDADWNPQWGIVNGKWTRL